MNSWLKATKSQPNFRVNDDMPMPRLFSGILSVGFMVLVGAVSGQDYPNKPIRIVTNGGIGSGSDFASRLIAQDISGRLGQPVIVDNRPSGVIPPETVSKAPPDGYTLLLSSGSFYIAALLRKMPYDPVRDFAPIALVSQEANVLVVHTSVAATSVKELVSLAKSRPAELNYSSGATGGTSHLAGELFKSLAGVNITRIPYKSDSVQSADLLGGQVHMTFGSVEQVMPHVKLGKLRALAVTSPRPSTLLPGLPTVAATVPGFEVVTRTGVFAPAKTPLPIIGRLNQEIVRVLNQSDTKAKFFSAGQEIVGSSADELGAAMQSYTAMMGKLIADTGIKAD